MSGALLWRPRLLPSELRSIPVVETGDHVRVHAVIPLHEDEVLYKLEAGTNALIARMDERAVTELLDPARPSVMER